MRVGKSLVYPLIFEMIEKEINIRVLQSVKDELEKRGQTIIEWLADQLILAFAIDEEKLFQKVGDEFLKLSMADIKPYDESLADVKPHELYDAITISPEAYEGVKNKSGDFRTWALKVMNLGMMAPNMNLYFLDESKEYHRIIVIPEEAELRS